MLCRRIEHRNDDAEARALGGRNRRHPRGKPTAVILRRPIVRVNGLPNDRGPAHGEAQRVRSSNETFERSDGSLVGHSCILSIEQLLERLDAAADSLHPADNV